MLLKLKRVLSVDFVKVSFLNAIATAIRMCTAMVSVKIVAVIIGPAGIAMLGQLNNFSTVLLSFSTGGINSGITKYVAEYSTSPKKYAVFLRTGFLIGIVLSAIISLVLIIGAGYFSQLIFNSRDYKAIFIVFGITTVFYSLNSLLLSVINGFKEYKKYVIANIITSVTGLFFSVILVLQFGIYGALIGTVTYQSVVFILTLLVVRKAVWFRWSAFVGRFSKAAAIKLGHYSLMALVTALTVPVSQIVVRRYLVTHESLDAAGIWEGMNRISGIYLMVITTSMGVYYLPRLSELKTQKAIREEIFSVYKIIVPAVLFLFSMLFLFRGLITHVVFSGKFSSMRELFAFQLIGDFLKVVSWVLAYQMVAKSMTKVFVMIEVFSSLGFILFSIIFINLYGTIGATIGYAVNYVAYTIAMVLIFRKMLFSKSTYKSV